MIRSPAPWRFPCPIACFPPPIALPCRFMPVAPDDLPDIGARLGERAAGWASATGFKAASGAISLVPGPDGGLAGRPFRSRRGGRSPAAACRPAADPAAGRHLPARIAASTTRRSPRSPSRSAPIASPATARLARPGRNSSSPARMTARPSRRIADGVTLARDLINTAAQRSRPGRAGRRRARRSPPATAPRSRRSSAKTCSPRTFR